MRVYAGRDKDVALAFEDAQRHLDLRGSEAREVEQHVRLHRVQRFLQLLLVEPIDRDVTGEHAVGPFLPAGCDGLDAAPHQLLARGDPDEAGAAEDEGAGQISRAVNSTSMPSTLSRRAAISRPIDTERCLPPVQPKATTRCERPRSR